MSVLRETDVYEFETSALKGAIRAGNALPHHGVTRLRHKQTGAEFAHPDWSMLNIFRIMGVDLEDDGGMGGDLGQPRSEEHEIEASDGALTLYWPPIPARRAGVRLKYEVGEDYIDVSVSVRAEAGYGRFDLLLSSYNNPEVNPHVFLARDKFELTDVPGKFDDEPELVRVTMHPATRGGVLIFPRDADAVRIFSDGRWDTLARFSPVRRYKVPLMFHRAGSGSVAGAPAAGPAAVWMTPPDTCFAMGTGYDSPDPDDRFTHNNPSYFSLFGQDVQAGDELSAKARLSIVELDDDYARPVRLYEEFVKDSSAG